MLRKLRHEFGKCKHVNNDINTVIDPRRTWGDRSPGTMIICTIPANEKFYGMTPAGIGLTLRKLAGKHLFVHRYVQLQGPIELKGYTYGFAQEVHCLTIDTQPDLPHDTAPRLVPARSRPTLP